jgi:hypothetical protein
MTDQILLETLKQSIQNNSFDLIEIKTVLLDYKNTGGEQAKAQKIVEDIRKSFENNEMFKNRTLEVLDLITGWCNPKFRVWNL